MSFRQTCIISSALAVVCHLAGCERPPATPRDRSVVWTDGTAQSPPARDALPAVRETAAAAARLGGKAPAQAATRPADPPPQPVLQGNAAPEAVLQRWAAAIERRDWASVRALWGGQGADSGLSPTAFAARWNGLRRPRVTVGAGQLDGAAGSIYYTAPVWVDDGNRAIAGTVTIRRVNDVPGASAEQLRWHLDAATSAPWTNPR